MATPEGSTLREGHGDGAGAASPSDKDVAEGFQTLVGDSIESCRIEVGNVVDSQRELQQSLMRVGQEVKRLIERLPKADVANQAAKLPNLKRRCVRLTSKMKEIQERLDRLATITLERGKQA